MSHYTGHLEPRGEASTRSLAAVTITKISVGPMNNNAYLITDRVSRDAILIDAANDASRLIGLIDGRTTGYDAVHVQAIVTTHRHPDHWQALAELAAHTGATLYAGAADADKLPVTVDVRLDHGDAIPFGGCDLGVVGLRGHTPGSIALVYRVPAGAAHLFTGDSLFPGGPGKTTTTADFTSLMDDLEDRVFGVFDNDTWIYPGHGDDTTLGAERGQLAEWRARGW